MNTPESLDKYSKLCQLIDEETVIMTPRLAQSWLDQIEAMIRNRSLNDRRMADVADRGVRKICKAGANTDALK